ncbi:hypothetical protein Droror1_Dr00013645 [Drosera rotundifolia]
MDYSGEWSSGCESGWTSYFDESSPSPNQWQSGNSNTHGHENRKTGNQKGVVEEEEEEDLSIVSDASSGPPSRFQEYYQDSFDPIPTGYSCPATDILPKKNDMRKKKKKNGSDQQRAKHQQQQQGYLDDTATSPALNHSKMRYAGTSVHQASVDHHAFDFPQRFPNTDQYQGNYALGNQFGFWQPTHPNVSDPAERSQMRGKRWK